MVHHRTVALSSVVLVAVLGNHVSAQSGFPAGTYQCLSSNFTLSRGITYEASALGRIALDGRDVYQVSATGNSGRYRISGASFIFLDGPLSGWPAIAEMAEGGPRIRLGRTREKPPNPNGPAPGEHRCTWRH